MPIHDPLIHPALLDPRQWGDVNLYESLFSVEREPIEEPERHAPDRSFDVQHLRLQLRFDDEQEAISGTATIILKPLQDNFTQLSLDAAELDVHSIRLITRRPYKTKARVAKSRQSALKDAGRTGVTLVFDTGQEKLSIELDRGYSRSDEITLAIDYSARPRKGLYFIKPDEAYPDKPRQIWSQGQTEDAHWWFPCVDTPQEKMTTEMIATVRADHFALSNGRLASVTENKKDKTKTYHWHQEEPHPAYLVTIVIGEYEHIADGDKKLPVDYYIYGNHREAGKKLFARTPQMIEFFSTKFGHLYPFAKYAQILVDDFLFGAMENTSATTMTDRCLLDEYAALDLNYDDIVAHELAHHWFGDLVTCKHWSEIWLNESFATYSETLWRQHTLGCDEARFALFQDFLTYLREDLRSHRRPIRFHRYRFSEDLMDRHAYEKGACVLDMLRTTLGDDAFFRSIEHYLHKHRFTATETHDLRAAIEEVTGKNLYWFFDQWIYGAGYPELEVLSEWQAEQKMLRVSVRQVQQHEDKEAALFRFPVDIEIALSKRKNDQPQRELFRVMVEKQEQDFYFPCAQRPRMVLFDKGHRVFKLMSFPKSQQELLYQLQYDQDAQGRARAAMELSGFKGNDTIAALRQKLSSDDVMIVRMAAAISLGETGTHSAREALMQTAGHGKKEFPVQIMRCITWALGKYPGDDTVDLLRTILESSRSYFVAVATVRALANIGSVPAFDALQSALEKNSWQEVIRAAVFHGLGIAKDKRAVDLAMEHTRYGQHVAVRVAAVNCLGAIGKELNKEKADDKILDHLLDLLKDKSIRVRVATIRSLGRVGNKRALPALREAQSRECLDQLKGALMDAIKGLEAKEN
jgi:aminopeptidase N